MCSLRGGKKQGVSLELEGTNSEGDLGFGIGLTYQHRNLAHGAELLSAKFRTSYESLSGDFNGLINNRYMEYAGEIGITFPQFEAPFLSYDFKRRIKATTEFSVSFNYQERPGIHSHNRRCGMEIPMGKPSEYITPPF